MEPVLNFSHVTLEYPDGEGTFACPRRRQPGTAPRRIRLPCGPVRFRKVVVAGRGRHLGASHRRIVLVAGQDAAALPDAGRTSLRRDNIGIIFQQPNLLPSLTAVEQLLVAAHLRAEPLVEARRKAVELLGRVGLASVLDKRPHQLSGGQRQRVNIARALMASPAVLLVDEPTAALDRGRSEEIVRLLRQVTDEFGVATLMVTHDTGLVSFTDAVATMQDGRLSAGILAAAS